MKTRRSLFTLVGTAVSLSTVTLVAGPGPQFWNRATPVTTTAEAKAVKPGDTVMMVCGACKTVVLTEFKSAQPNGRPPMSWFEVGSKHECEHCGGAITIVRGKTTDSMQHNCSKCGEGAAFCCAVKADTPPAKS